MSYTLPILLFLIFPNKNIIGVRNKPNSQLNIERLRKFTEDYVVSNKKIKDVLKKELPLTVTEGIMKTALSFKNA